MGATGIILGSWLFFDVWYFLRVAAGSIYSITLHKPKDFLGHHTIQSMCTTTDLDWMIHKNNARYLRECDMGRLGLFLSCGFGKAAYFFRGHGMVLAASTVRYRKPINFLMRYKICTQILCWDKQSFYIEQKFISNRDNFIRAVVLSKQQLLDTTPDEVVKVYTGEKKESPEMPDYVKAWVKHNEMSSEILKKQTRRQ